MKLKITKHPAVNQLYYSESKHQSPSAFVEGFYFGNYLLFGLIIHIVKEFIIEIHRTFFRAYCPFNVLLLTFAGKLVLNWSVRILGICSESTT